MQTSLRSLSVYLYLCLFLSFYSNSHLFIKAPPPKSQQLILGREIKGTGSGNDYIYFKLEWNVVNFLSFVRECSRPKVQSVESFSDTQDGSEESTTVISYSLFLTTHRIYVPIFLQISNFDPCRVLCILLKRTQKSRSCVY